MTHRWQQHLADYLFVVTESVAWFMPIALITTWTERGFLSQIATRIPAELPRGAEETLLLERVTAASHSVVSGPGVWLVALTGVLAFALMRTFTRARLAGGLGALAMLVISVLALNALLHIAIAGDLKFWDTSGVASFLNNPASQFPDRLDLQRFAAGPVLDRPHGAAATMTFLGLVVVWARFLLAGRSSVTFERAARSFTIGFVATLALVLAADGGGARAIAAYAVPYFVLGVLTLAVAHSARPQAAMEGARRVAPWVLSVAVTVAALGAAGVVLGLLALLDVGSAVQFGVDGLFRLLGWLLIVIVTPLFWLVEQGAHLLHLHVQPNLVAATPSPTPRAVVHPASGQAGSFAELLLFALKLVALTLLTYGLFAGLRFLLNRRRPETVDDFVELRSSASASEGGLGGLLRNLVPHRRAATGSAWMRRHAIYALFGRAVRDAHERGLSIRPGETPLEFAEVGRRLLDAEPLPAIAAEFDRARYGRHFADREAVERLERRLEEWERSHPPTAEQRERIGGARALSDAEDFEARITLAKRASRGDSNARRLL